MSANDGLEDVPDGDYDHILNNQEPRPSFKSLFGGLLTFLKAGPNTANPPKYAVYPIYRLEYKCLFATYSRVLDLVDKPQLKSHSDAIELVKSIAERYQHNYDLLLECAAQAKPDDYIAYLILRKRKGNQGPPYTFHLIGPRKHIILAAAKLGVKRAPGSGDTTLSPAEAHAELPFLEVTDDLSNCTTSISFLIERSGVLPICLDEAAWNSRAIQRILNTEDVILKLGLLFSMTGLFNKAILALILKYNPSYQVNHVPLPSGETGALPTSTQESDYLHDEDQTYMKLMPILSTCILLLSSSKNTENQRIDFIQARVSAALGAIHTANGQTNRDDVASYTSPLQVILALVQKNRDLVIRIKNLSIIPVVRKILETTFSDQILGAIKDQVVLCYKYYNCTTIRLVSIFTMDMEPSGFLSDLISIFPTLETELPKVMTLTTALDDDPHTLVKDPSAAVPLSSIPLLAYGSVLYSMYMEQYAAGASKTGKKASMENFGTNNLRAKALESLGSPNQQETILFFENLICKYAGEIFCTRQDRVSASIPHKLEHEARAAALLSDYNAATATTILPSAMQLPGTGLNYSLMQRQGPSETDRKLDALTQALTAMMTQLQHQNQPGV